MDEPPKHHAKWRKPDTKNYALYDGICIKYPEKQIQIDRGRLAVAWGLENERMRRNCMMGRGFYLCEFYLFLFKKKKELSVKWWDSPQRRCWEAIIVLFVHIAVKLCAPHIFSHILFFKCNNWWCPKLGKQYRGGAMKEKQS